MAKVKRYRRNVSPATSAPTRGLSTRQAPPSAAALSPRSAAKRRDILTAAWTLLPARGFGRTGMRELAQEAGVSTATIYAHFATKHDLIVALIRERWQDALRHMLERAMAVADPLERLLVGVIDLNHAIAADPLLRHLLVTPRRPGDTQVERQAGPIEDMMDARCAEAIRAAVAAGRLVCDDPEALAVLIRVSMQGWLLTESKRPHPMSEERITRALTTLIRAVATD